MYLNESVKSKINKLNTDSLYIIIDFDRTITTVTSMASFGIITKSDVIMTEYLEERKDNYAYYRAIELDEAFNPELKEQLMLEWAYKSLGLFIKYGFTETIINETLKQPDVMNFRDGAEQFLKFTYDKNIPVIIMSAGLKKVIVQFLKNQNCLYDNIIVISNELEFVDDVAVGIIGDIITSSNKSYDFIDEEVKNKLVNRNQIILIGDHLSDINMAPFENRDDTIRIGFLEEGVEENKDKFIDNFDIVYFENGDFYDVMKILNF